MSHTNEDGAEQKLAETNDIVLGDESAQHVIRIEIDPETTTGAKSHYAVLLAEYLSGQRAELASRLEQIEDEDDDEVLLLDAAIATLDHISDKIVTDIVTMNGYTVPAGQTATVETSGAQR